jgi:hypothetical protein
VADVLELVVGVVLGVVAVDGVVAAGSSVVAGCVGVAPELADVATV